MSREMTTIAIEKIILLLLCYCCRSVVVICRRNVPKTITKLAGNPGVRLGPRTMEAKCYYSAISFATFSTFS